MTSRRLAAYCAYAKEGDLKRLLLGGVVLAAVAVPACKKDSPAGPSPTPIPTATPTAAPTATPTNLPPVFEIKAVPAPPAGPAPFTLLINMCRSYDPEEDELVYEYRWKGDVHKFKNFCRDDFTYTVPGQYRAWFCVKDPFNTSVCKSYVVNVS